jgi:phosphoglycolate phosphatase
LTKEVGMRARRISAILFDKDGTLLDYHLSWQPINVRAAQWAAAGDPDLARALLLAGGGDPETGRVQSNSLLAAGTTREIAAQWAASGSPYPVETLIREIDRIFCDGVATVVPVVDLAAFFARLRSRGLRLGIASSDSVAAIEATAARFGFGGVSKARA